MTFTGGETATHVAVVLANGHRVNGTEQTQSLSVYSVGGQVSHIPTTPSLLALHQMLYYDGYFTPHNPQNQRHCIGASCHRGSEETVYRVDGQQQDHQHLVDCFSDASRAKEVDASSNAVRCGVRYATRDRMPMMGNIASYDTTLGQYATLTEDKMRAVNAPVYSDLFMLGALGSRGLCTAPLYAEILASQMNNEPMPMDTNTLAALDPSRLWVRKLLKGRAVK